MNDYQKALFSVAHSAAEKLLEACRAENAQGGAAVAMQIHGAQNPELLMMVLGRLATRVVELEKGVVGQPLVAVETDSPTQSWAVSKQDQMSASLADGDIAEFGRIAVDGLLQAARLDGAERVIDHNYTLGCMLPLDQLSLIAIGSNMLLRLSGQEV